MGNIKGAVESFCKAKDAQDYTNMVSQASAAEAWEELVTYLKMARSDGGLNKEPVVDTELTYALAKCNELAELEELVNSPNVAQIQVVGDKCFDAASTRLPSCCSSTFPTMVALHLPASCLESSRLLWMLPRKPCPLAHGRRSTLPVSRRANSASHKSVVCTSLCTPMNWMTSLPSTNTVATLRS